MLNHNQNYYFPEVHLVDLQYSILYIDGTIDGILDLHIGSNVQFLVGNKVSLLPMVPDLSYLC